MIRTFCPRFAIRPAVGTCGYFHVGIALEYQRIFAFRTYVGGYHARYSPFVRFAGVGGGSVIGTQDDREGQVIVVRCTNAQALLDLTFSYCPQSQADNAEFWIVQLYEQPQRNYCDTFLMAASPAARA